MKRIIRVSKTWMAALVFGIVLNGCGGGSGSQGADPQSGSQVSGTQSVDRSATLSWEAPKKRQNNQGLFPNELDYIIRYGRDPENLDIRVPVSGYQGGIYPSRLEHTVSDLSDGEWHFSVRAVDQDGLESPPSAVVSKTIKS